MAMELMLDAYNHDKEIDDTIAHVYKRQAYKDVCRLRWRTYIKPLSEFLEHLASYNGADTVSYTHL